jgi:hypothetical protein
MTKKRAITFKKLQEICIHRYTLNLDAAEKRKYCAASRPNATKCLAESCPIWKKLGILLALLLLCSPVWAEQNRYYDDLLFNHTTTTIRTTAEMPVEPIVGGPTKVEWFPDTTTTSIDPQLYFTDVYFTDEEWERVEGALTTTTIGVSKYVGAAKLRDWSRDSYKMTNRDRLEFAELFKNISKIKIDSGGWVISGFKEATTTTTTAQPDKGGPGGWSRGSNEYNGGGAVFILPDTSQDNETARGQWVISGITIFCYTITTADINRMTDHEVENLARLLAITDRLQGAEGIAIACRLLPHWLTERNRECERQGE